ncbi:transposase IS66-like protein [Rhizobium sp. BK251]|nr:transposase IS66-like protein [Rhizobium sp. BK251]
MSRQGVDLDRSTLADWDGRAAFELRPVFDALLADLKRSTKLFMDETRAPVLDPGSRKTKTGYFWALARDDRLWDGGAPPGGALPTYIAKYWDGLCVFLTDGRIEIDNNSVERTIRPIALNRKNALFAGHDTGAENWGTIASLVETCKLNAVDPFGYLTSTLTALVNGHKQSQIAHLLPWNYLVG